MMTHTSNWRHSDLEHRLCTAALIYNGEDIKRYKNNMDKVLMVGKKSLRSLDNLSPVTAKLDAARLNRLLSSSTLSLAGHDMVRWAR